MHLAKFDWRVYPAFGGSYPRFQLQTIRLFKHGHWVPYTDANLMDPSVYPHADNTGLWVERISGAWCVLDCRGKTVHIPCRSKDEAFSVAEATYELGHE